MTDERIPVDGIDTYDQITARLLASYERPVAEAIWMAMLRVLNESADAQITWLAHRMAITRDVLVAPGVLAWVFDKGAAGIEVKHVLSVREGSGDVGRWIDSLAPCRKIVVPNVTSPRLMGMLTRRGYGERQRAAEITQTELVWMDVMVRRPVPGMVLGNHERCDASFSAWGCERLPGYVTPEHPHVKAR